MGDPRRLADCCAAAVAALRAQGREAQVARWTARAVRAYQSAGQYTEAWKLLEKEPAVVKVWWDAASRFEGELLTTGLLAAALLDSCAGAVELSRSFSAATSDAENARHGKSLQPLLPATLQLLKRTSPGILDKIGCHVMREIAAAGGAKKAEVTREGSRAGAAPVHPHDMPSSPILF